MKFFGTQLAGSLDGGRSADLVLGNNVLAQVPDLNDFVEGLKILLKPKGVLTLEFPHLLKLIEHNEFDTIYHEHFSYFSLLATIRLMENHGLRVFDVEELPSHGGSLRVYACRAEAETHPVEPGIGASRRREKGRPRHSGRLHEFRQQVKETKMALLEFLIEAVREGKTVAAMERRGRAPRY